MTTKKRKWQVQAVPRRDHFDTCTLSVEEWLAKGNEGSWLDLMEVCAVVLPNIASGGLRHGPRVGFDPARDQLYFLFKNSNNDTTYLVSSEGIAFDKEETLLPVVGDEVNGLSPARCRLDVITLSLPPPPGHGYRTAAARLMQVSEGFDPVGFVNTDDDGNTYADRVNIGCPSCGEYVLILQSDYKHENQVSARCLAGCTPLEIRVAAIERVKNGRPT